jgi:hypothetical protein
VIGEKTLVELLMLMSKFTHQRKSHNSLPPLISLKKLRLQIRLLFPTKENKLVHHFLFVGGSFTNGTGKNFYS